MSPTQHISFEELVGLRGKQQQTGQPIGNFYFAIAATAVHNDQTLMT